MPALYVGMHPSQLTAWEEATAIKHWMLNCLYANGKSKYIHFVRISFYRKKWLGLLYVCCEIHIYSSVLACECKETSPLARNLMSWRWIHTNLQK
jgi:hypothetical protein